jgi:hypothetical protein
VIVRAGAWTAVDFDRGGYETDVTTALGPEIALAVIQAWVVWGEYDVQSTWDEHWGNEGALIDLDRQVLIINSEQLDPAKRIAYLRMLTKTWPGWSISWAYTGWAAFADYLGVSPPPVQVSTPSWLRPDRPRPDAAFASFEAYGSPAMFPRRKRKRAKASDGERFARPLTVADADGRVQCYAMSVDDPWHGPELLDLLPDVGDVRFTRPPLCGMHLDLATKTAGLWARGSYPDVHADWPLVWPEWSLQLWEDHDEEQIRRSAGRLDWPAVDEEAGRASYAERLDDCWLRWIAGTVSDDPVVDEGVPAAVGLTVERYRELCELGLGPG